jgi:DNA-binding NarL/FixJ family response regulator
MKYGRVILADSHLNMLKGVHGLLTDLFRTVIMVADECSLLAAIPTLEPELVVVDLSLPPGGVANIATRLMASYPGLHLIVLSTHDDSTVADLIRGAGAAGCVLKRTAATDLAPAIHEVLRGGTYVSPVLRQREGEKGNGATAGFDH